MNKLPRTLTLALAAFFWYSPNTSYAFTCSDARTLECGNQYWFEAPLNDHLNGINYDLWNCGYSPWAYDGKDELYIIDVGAAPVNLHIRLTNLSDNLDLFVFRNCRDHYNAITLDDCVGISTNSSYLDEEVIVYGATGAFYIAVDGPSYSNSSDFILEVVCEDQPSLCATIPEINCGQKVYGDNWGYSEGVTDIIDHHNECYDWNKKYDGPEHIYKISAHYYSLRDVTIDLYSHGYHVDHDLFLYTRCDEFKDSNGKWHYSFSGLLNYCHEQYKPYTNHETAFIEHVPEYGEIYIVVESRPDHYGHSSSGSFELVVSCGGPCDQKKYKLECNSTVSGSTIGRKNKASYYACGHYEDKGHNWGPEMTYYFDLYDETEITIELAPEAYADLNLYLLSECDQSACVAYGKHKGKGVTETIRKVLWPGRYYVVVEGYRGDSGDFELRIGGCNCYNSPFIGCDEKIYGHTAGGTRIVNELKDDCFRLSSNPVDVKGPENIYVFRAPESRSYTFELSDLDKNVDLYLIGDCRNVNSCMGFSTKSGTSNESITLDMHAYEEVLILIDSWSDLLTSSYNLEVRCTPVDDDEGDDDEGGDGTSGDDEEIICFESSIENIREVKIDLSDVYDEECPDSLQFLLVYPIVDGSIDSSKVDTLPIADKKAAFVASLSADDQYFHVIYEKKMDDLVVQCGIDIQVAPVIGCGMSISGSTIGAQSNFQKEDIEACYSSASKFNGPDQLVPFVKENDEDIIGVTLFQNTDNLSLFILDENLDMVRTPCKGNNFNTDKIIGNSGAIGEYFTDAEDPLPAGMYYALIEGFAKKIADDFTLTLSCSSDCGDLVTLACGESISSTNEGSTSIHDAYESDGLQYLGYTGPEAFYQFVLETETEVEITLENMISLNGETMDLDIFLFEGDCQDGLLLASGLEEGDTDESISLNLEAGMYSLVVDGWNHSVGSYDLSILGCDIGASLPNIEASNRSRAFGTEKVFVRPNPFQNSVYIHWDGTSLNADIQLYQSDGSLLWKGRSDRAPLSIGDKELGTYTGLIYYRIITNSETHTGAMIRIR